eukprot:2408526-Pyramimonas_sp.AAC.1
MSLPSSFDEGEMLEIDAQLPLETVKVCEKLEEREQKEEPLEDVKASGGDKPLEDVKGQKRNK